jgi:hypothetical protein
MEMTYSPKINGMKYCLFAAMYRVVRTLFHKVYNAKTSENAVKFTN